jgi:hypothetical protein
VHPSCAHNKRAGRKNACLAGHKQAVRDPSDHTYIGVTTVVLVLRAVAGRNKAGGGDGVW